MAKLFPKNVIDLACVLPDDQALLIRGPHGIGKSQIARQVSRKRDKLLIDLRLSQMTEGDFLGLPKVVEPQHDKDGRIIRRGMTEFRPPWWFVKAQDEGVVLFLDEINRAVPEVMQCAFQLVLDRAIQGKSVHPETRIIAAVNASPQYQVNEMDPALLDRFLVVDMVPDIKGWIGWARENGLDGSIIEFCRENQTHWWHDPTKNLEPNKVYPTPRAWEMLHNCLTQAGMFQTKPNILFRHMCIGLVGDEAGEAFTQFVKDYDRNISAEDILDGYPTGDVRKRVEDGLTVEQTLNLIEKLVVSCSSRKWTKAQARNLNAFMCDLSNAEMVFSLWNRINGLQKQHEDDRKARKRVQANALLVHSVCRDVIIRAVSQGSDAV